MPSDEAQEAIAGATTAICDRAAELAKDADPEQIAKLADSVSKLTHGPQGGLVDYNYHATFDGHQPRARTAGFGMAPPGSDR